MTNEFKKMSDMISEAKKFGVSKTELKELLTSNGMPIEMAEKMISELY